MYVAHEKKITHPLGVIICMYAKCTVVSRDISVLHGRIGVFGLGAWSAPYLEVQSIVWSCQLGGVDVHPWLTLDMDREIPSPRFRICDTFFVSGQLW